MSIKNKLKSFFSVEDEYEYIDEETYADSNPEPEQTGKNSNVISLKSMQQSSKLVLCEPRMYNEAQEIADHLKNRKAVVINLQRVDHHQAKRIVDFLSGTVYAINGDIQKLGQQTFLCTPDNVDVSGSISDMFDDHQSDHDQRW